MASTFFTGDYTRWAFAQLAEFPDEQRTLIFLNDVSPCDVADLERVVKPVRPIQRVLGKLLEYGLVEREADNIYRLNPLLANRLNRDLIRPELVDWFRQAAKAFVANPPEFETPDHEFTRIESRIHAALISGEGQIPVGVARFVSAAHWFQAGIRLYHANRRDPAYRLLKKAFEQRAEFSHTSRVEIIRYYCLSATRLRKFDVSDECIRLLMREHRTKAIAEFLRGNVHEFKGEYPDAIICYEAALHLNRGNETRLEHTYRPLISCILRTHNPNFPKAERYALSYVGLRRTTFSLMGLARVYLHWKYRGAESPWGVPDDIDELYYDALDDLANHPGVNGSHFEVRSEEAEFEKDYTGAIEYMNQAVAADPRPILRNERWRLMAMHGGLRAAEQVIREMDLAKTTAEFSNNWGSYVPMLAETYARALRIMGKPLGQVNQFAVSLTDGEISRIIGKVNSRRNQS